MLWLIPAVTPTITTAGLVTEPPDGRMLKCFPTLSAVRHGNTELVLGAAVTALSALNTLKPRIQFMAPGYKQPMLLAYPLQMITTALRL